MSVRYDRVLTSQGRWKVHVHVFEGGTADRAPNSFLHYDLFLTSARALTRARFRHVNCF